MLLVPALLVHTNEVLVPTRQGGRVWMTAPKARAQALRDVDESERELAEVTLQLREMGFTQEEGEGVGAASSSQGAERDTPAALLHAAQQFAGMVKPLGPNAFEVDVDGEKLVYIKEFEEGEEGPPHAGGATGRNVGAHQPTSHTQSAARTDEEAWRAFDARVAAAEAAEAADRRKAGAGGGGGARPVTSAPTSTQGHAAAHHTSGKPLPRPSILGAVTERPADAGGASGAESEGLPTRPVSKFKLDRMRG